MLRTINGILAPREANRVLGYLELGVGVFYSYVTGVWFQFRDISKNYLHPLFVVVLIPKWVKLILIVFVLIHHFKYVHTGKYFFTTLQTNLSSNLSYHGGLHRTWTYGEHPWPIDVANLDQQRSSFFTVVDVGKFATSRVHISRVCLIAHVHFLNCSAFDFVVVVDVVCHIYHSVLVGSFWTLLWGL
jgi:hypothetical protein